MASIRKKKVDDDYRQTKRRAANTKPSSYSW